MRTPYTILATILISSSTIASPAAAQQPPRGESGSGEQQQQRPMGPPPEAFEVCAQARTEDSCAINTPHGTIEGQCLPDRRDQAQLVCVPEHDPANHGPGPGGHDRDSSGRPQGPPPGEGRR